METQKTSGWTFVSFVIGAAVGLGAGVLTARAYKTKARQLLPRKRIRTDNGGDSETRYCAVPQGADICYPE